MMEEHQRRTVVVVFANALVIRLTRRVAVFDRFESKQLENFHGAVRVLVSAPELTTNPIRLLATRVG